MKTENGKNCTRKKEEENRNVKVPATFEILSDRRAFEMTSG